MKKKNLKEKLKAFIRKTKKLAEDPQKVTKAEAAEILAKAEKKIEEDKFSTIIQQLETMHKSQTKYQDKVDRMENILSAKDSQDQKTQTKLSSEEEIAKIEADQDKQKSQGQPQQLTPEQYQKMSDSEKVPLLEAQLQAERGNPNNFAKIMQGINAVSPVVIEALRHNQKNSGSIGSFFENLKIYSGVENAMLGNVFRFFKLLSPNQQAQGAQSLIEKAANLPGFPEIPPIDTGHIGE